MPKDFCRPRVFKRRWLTKLLFVMNFTAIFILVLSLAATAAGHGQNISLNLKNAPLEKLFTEVQKQSTYSFVYFKNDLRKAKTIDVKVENGTIAEILEAAFKAQPLTYTIVEHSIIIKKKPAEHLSTPQASPSLSNPPITIRGRIVNEKGEPVIASIVVKGTNRGVTSNDDGYFELSNIESNARLIISATNIETCEYRLTGADNETITVKSLVNPLENVVFKGYYSTSKRFNTGAVSTVSSEEISRQPVSNPLLALQGRVPGMIVSQTRGIAGAAPFVQIRGRNSISNGNEPLYIIDGVPFATNTLQTSAMEAPVTLSPFNSINPADIESVEILKDADATAIYGSRGANGVILITTKKGKAGATKVDFNIYTGVNRHTRFQKYLNTQQYLEMRREAFKNDGAVPGPGDFDVNGDWDTTRYTDWVKELVARPSHVNDARLSLSGGNANTQFLIGGGYRKESAPFDGDFANTRASMHFNINNVSNNKKFRMNLSGTYSVEKNTLPSGDPATIINLPPNMPALINDDGSLNWVPGFYIQPYSYLKQPYTAKTNTLLSNLSLSYEIFNGFLIKSSFGYTNTSFDEKLIRPLTTLTPDFYTSGNSKFADKTTSGWIIEPQAEYQYKSSGHTIKVLAGATFQRNIAEGEYIFADDFSNDAQLENIGAAAKRTIALSYSDYRYNAAFGNINYSFTNRYIVNLTFRRDGSSRFGPGRQFANFGAAGLAWIFSEEEFMRNALPFLSFGKIRGSYGLTGNDQIGDYRYLNTYTSATRPYLGVTGLIPTRVANDEYGWETNKKLEAAIELGFLQDRILFTAARYRNLSSSQLIDYSLAPTTGNTSVQRNLPATILNNGWEFDLSSVNVRSKKLTWRTSANLTIPRDKLVSFPDLEGSSYGYFYFIGESLSSRNALINPGVDPATGLYTFVDKDGETVAGPSFDNTNRKHLVNTARRFFGGINNSVSYKGFQLDVLFQFVKQNGYSHQRTSPLPGTFNNQPVSVLNRWRKAGDITDVQRFSQNFSEPYMSYAYATMLGDLAIVDASFIRLKNISLFYNLAGNWLNAIKVQSARVYATAQNLLTITNYNGDDPETQYGLPPMRTITAGVQLNF